MTSSSSSSELARSPVLRGLFGALGVLCVVLGIAGVILPVLPATPFFLAASFCFLRSSRRLHHWLTNHPRFGPFLVRFRTQGLTKKEKLKIWVVAFAMLTVTAILVPSWHLRAFLAVLVVVKTVVLWKLPTAPRSNR